MRKSTLGKTLMASTADGGRERFAGREIGGLGRRARRVLPGICSVYQIPAHRRPALKIRRMLHEPLQIHTALSRGARPGRDDAAAVGLPDAHLDLYPHELSGDSSGAWPARTLMLRPSLVILDEEERAEQASVLKPSAGCRPRCPDVPVHLSRFAVVRAMCQAWPSCTPARSSSWPRRGPVRDPRHPYTRSLLSAVS
jgi:ABC-type oligopeptide transport system ATPase subunit